MNANITVSVKVQTRILDAKTKKVIKQSPWMKNLVLDKGLNSLARQGALACTPANATAICSVGSSAAGNSVNSGGLTVSQAAFTATASGAFFDPSHVGGILKYGSGSGGVEYYITAYISSTQVTVDTSATVAATSATIWLVQQTALTAKLYEQSSYQTNSGDCVSTLSTANIVHQRSYVFGTKGAPYSVNEIGWSPQTGATICGRLVLPATDNIGTSNIYVVVIAVTYTYTPVVPTAVLNVGTGFDTSGNAMIEYWNCNIVNSDGSTNTTNAALDSGNVFLVFAVATYTQNGTIQNTAPATWSGAIFPASASWANNAAVRGQMRLSFVGTTSIGATTTIYGFGFNPSGAIKPPFDVKLTTPVVLAVGTFAPSCVMSMTYNRVLTNP